MQVELEAMDLLTEKKYFISSYSIFQIIVFFTFLQNPNFEADMINEAMMAAEMDLCNDGGGVDDF